MHLLPTKTCFQITFALSLFLLITCKNTEKKSVGFVETLHGRDVQIGRLCHATSLQIVPPLQISKSRQSHDTIMTPTSNTNNNSSQISCRIIGSIVHIYDNFQLHDTSGVCAKAPCEAIVKIETIKRRGASFTGAIAAGEKIKVHFAFTLNPTTKELFPNMAARYPGLKKNDKFVADIQSRLAIGGNENAKYVIYGYEKIE
ncbi:MAG: hypothetical protein FVQ77_14430 [Cytophagales bacterium]|nr:hypothetical protein [Cytophagales bacterium]